MEVPAEMRCWRVQGGFASKKATIRRGWQEEEDGEHGMDKAQKKVLSVVVVARIATSLTMWIEQWGASDGGKEEGGD